MWLLITTVMDMLLGVNMWQHHVLNGAVGLVCMLVGAWLAILNHLYNQTASGKKFNLQLKLKTQLREKGYFNCPNCGQMLKHPSGYCTYPECNWSWDDPIK